MMSYLSSLVNCILYRSVYEPDFPICVSLHTFHCSIVEFLFSNTAIFISIPEVSTLPPNLGSGLAFLVVVRLFAVEKSRGSDPVSFIFSLTKNGPLIRSPQQLWHVYFYVHPDVIPAFLILTPGCLMERRTHL